MVTDLSGGKGRSVLENNRRDIADTAAIAVLRGQKLCSLRLCESDIVRSARPGDASQCCRGVMKVMVFSRIGSQTRSLYSSVATLCVETSQGRMSRSLKNNRSQMNRVAFVAALKYGRRRCEKYRAFAEK